MNTEQNDQKFKELVLYISQRCASDPTFGAVKLNKILYFSDFFSYAKSGQAITGFEYQKLPNGPAPRRLLPVRQQMVAEGILGIQEVPLRNGRTQKRTVNLRKPNLAVLSGEEVALVDYVIESFREVNAERVSDISHQMVGWQIMEVGEEIPYNTVFLSNEPLSEAEIQRGHQLAQSLIARRIAA